MLGHALFPHIEAEKKSEETEAKKVFRSKTNAYSKLKNSTENIRSLSMPASTPKCDEGTYFT